MEVELGELKWTFVERLIFFLVLNMRKDWKESLFLEGIGNGWWTYEEY